MATLPFSSGGSARHPSFGGRPISQSPEPACESDPARRRSIARRTQFSTGSIPDLVAGFLVSSGTPPYDRFIADNGMPRRRRLRDGMASGKEVRISRLKAREHDDADHPLR